MLSGTFLDYFELKSRSYLLHRPVNTCGSLSGTNMLQPGDGTKALEMILLLSPYIPELEPERTCVIDIFTPFNSDTDKELSWSIFIF